MRLAMVRHKPGAIVNATRQAQLSWAQPRMGAPKGLSTVLRGLPLPMKAFASWPSTSSPAPAIICLSAASAQTAYRRAIRSASPAHPKAEPIKSALCIASLPDQFSLPTGRLA